MPHINYCLIFQNILAFTNSSVPSTWTVPLADEISFPNNYSPDNSKGYSFCKVSQLESGKSNGRSAYETCAGKAGAMRLAMTLFGPHWYGFGYPRQPPPQITLAQATFHFFLHKIQLTVYKTIPTNPSRRARKLGRSSCLAFTDRITLARTRFFPHINTLAP